MTWHISLLVVSIIGLAQSQYSGSSSSSANINTETATILFYRDFNNFAASVVAADECDTTYIFDCTNSLCNLGGQVTHTQSASGYDETFSPTVDVSVTGVSMSCSASGSSAAVCTSTKSMANGSAETTSVTLGDIDALPAYVPITAGGHLLAAATGECNPSTKSTKSTGSSAPVTAAITATASTSSAGSQTTTTLMSNSSGYVFVNVPFFTSWSSALAASIVSADACQATMMLKCTDSNACSGMTGTMMLTGGPGWYEQNFGTTIDGAAASMSESCTFVSGQATCSGSVQVLAGSSTVTAFANTTTTTYTNGTIEVTGGQAKIQVVTGLCTSSHSGAVATPAVQVYKVLVVPAAALVAIAGVLV